MIKIVTKENDIYTVKSIRHRENGIVFEYKGQDVFVSNANIKMIDGSFSPVNAKSYIPRK